MSVQILEAYARLKALRQNVPETDVDTKYVREFHAILDLLQNNTAADLNSFRIPSSEIRPVITGGNYLSGETYYSDEPYCDYGFFIMKVEGALMLFELLSQQSSSGKEPVGFRPPQSLR